MRRAVVVLGLAALAALQAGGCGTKVRDYRCVTVENAASVDVGAIWSCNRKIIARAVEGKGFSLREFRRAAAFFERLTGIAADTRPSPQGPLPGPRLDRSLVAWDGWLADRPAGLRWDAERGRVVRQEEAH